MDERPACSLCQHSCDERWVGDGTRAFCTNCLKAIGRFASYSPARAAMWPELNGSPEAPASQDSELERGSAGAAPEDQHWGDVFIDFTKGLNVVMGPEDAETHLDLGMAYREMGLIADALMETAVALRHEEHLPRSRAREALGLIFDRRHLRVGVDETLVALRGVLFAN